MQENDLLHPRKEGDYVWYGVDREIKLFWVIVASTQSHHEYARNDYV